MKKMFKLTSVVLCAIFILCAFAACSNDETTIVGKWAYETDDSVYHTFNEDGTGSYTFMGGEMKFTYTDDGAALTIQYESATEPNVFKYTIEGDTLKIEDSFGEMITYIKK